MIAVLDGRRRWKRQLKTRKEWIQFLFGFNNFDNNNHNIERVNIQIQRVMRVQRGLNIIVNNTRKTVLIRHTHKISSQLNDKLRQQHPDGIYGEEVKYQQ